MKLFKDLIVGILVYGVVYGFFAKVLMNGQTDMVEKYRQMKSDMDNVVERGGVVVFSKENERGGAALVMRGIDAGSVYKKLLDIYRGGFISRGWNIVDSNARKIAFCMGGV
ncbi:hypothetical protein DM992_28955 [Burkholderia sp. JP2-270]|uniref:hypothetical protein n=1 Tax=Burkholderia sp. JP2-270 TaxID=2217913 RepID=UPI000DA34DF6|nr:hypothetical protein [Burkholderia sp. JP2-270]AWV03303.1 hypothetical protein DM992_28955 [Burkholderia sp. JP2-270]